METPSSAPLTDSIGDIIPAAPTVLDAAGNPVATTLLPPVVVVGSVADGRARFLRTKQPRFELATIDGAEVALVVPAEGTRGEISQLTIDVDKTGRMRPGNSARRRALTVIAMVHTVITDPTTGQKKPGAKIFADADLPTLVNEQSSPESVIGLFGPACDAVLERVDAGAIEAAKNG